MLGHRVKMEAARSSEMDIITSCHNIEDLNLSPSAEADSRWAGQEIPCLLCSPNVYYRV